MTRISMLSLAAGAFGALVAAAAPLSAQTPPPIPASASSPQVFNACYVPLIGTVYIIKETGLSPQCFGPSNGPWKHVSVSWTDGAGALRSTDPAGGDVSGTFANLLVAKLQGVALNATGASNGQVLTFDGPTSTWKPGTPAASAGGTSANTPNSLVQRDASGGFAAGALTLSGKLDLTSNDGFVARGTFNSGSIRLPARASASCGTRGGRLSGRVP